MKSGKTEASSDLQAARASSQKLRDQAAPAAARTPKRQVAVDIPYARFSASRVVPPETPGQPARSGSALWGELLDRCLWASGLQAAFLTDASGLALARAGAIDDAQAEMFGARLAVTVTQAADMSQSAHHAVTVAVDVGGAWVTGMSVRAPDGTTLLLGLVGAQPVAGPTREEVLRVVSRIVGG